MLKPFKIPLMLLLAVSLSGCQYDVLHPSGWVAGQERNLLIISVLLMLIVILPVLFMAVYFPWKYRADRPETDDYDPTFTHSNKLEVLIWGVPVLIVIALGAFTWVYTHKLDPYRPLDLAHAGEPIEVEAVSLDWKWLFIYPEYGVASVNELAMPVNRPVNFRLTSSTVMNTLSIPALSGMVYSMPAMQTKIHMIADEVGTFAGRSAHYSGPGFSQMTFDAKSMTDADFDAWIAKAKTVDTPLTRASYLELEKPSIGNDVAFYSTVEDGLFDRIRNLCVGEGKVCMDQMMMVDMHGGGGLAGIKDKAAFEYDGQRAIDGFGNLMDAPGAGLIDGNDDTDANDKPDVDKNTRSAPAMEHN